MGFLRRTAAGAVARGLAISVVAASVIAIAQGAVAEEPYRGFPDELSEEFYCHRGRPANLFTLVQGQENPVCQDILAQLNEAKSWDEACGYTDRCRCAQPDYYMDPILAGREVFKWEKVKLPLNNMGNFFNIRHLLADINDDGEDDHLMLNTTFLARSSVSIIYIDLGKYAVAHSREYVKRLKESVGALAPNEARQYFYEMKDMTPSFSSDVNSVVLQQSVINSNGISYIIGANKNIKREESDALERRRYNIAVIYSVDRNFNGRLICKFYFGNAK